MFYFWAVVTWVLGAAFIGLEVTEFSDLVARGDGPTHSAFLSAFFTLVGTHGCHVSSGLLWLLVMMAQVATLGLRTTVVRRLFCFSLFWHALDLVWIGVFTIVYLGARSMSDQESSITAHQRYQPRCRRRRQPTCRATCSGLGLRSS